MKDLFLSADKIEVALDLNRIDALQANAFEQIDTLYTSYLGPRSEIDSLKEAFVIWNSMREETIPVISNRKHI